VRRYSASTPTETACDPYLPAMPMEILLYYAPITCSLVPYITLTEANARFEVRPHPIRAAAITFAARGSPSLGRCGSRAVGTRRAGSQDKQSTSRLPARIS
jgi:hypothetical protein